MSSDLNENQRENKSPLIANVLAIGFTGGVLGSFAGIAAHFFKFMSFSPKFILTSWSDMAWVDRWLGTLMTMIIFGLLSIVWAFIYYSILKKLKGIFPGILFGIAIWLLLVFVFKPMFSDFPTLAKMSSDTIVTSICILVLYGLFVGYSISYDHEEYMRQETTSHSKG